MLLRVRSYPASSSHFHTSHIIIFSIFSISFVPFIFSMCKSDVYMPKHVCEHIFPYFTFIEKLFLFKICLLIFCRFCRDLGPRNVIIGFSAKKYRVPQFSSKLAPGKIGLRIIQILTLHIQGPPAARAANWRQGRKNHTPEPLKPQYGLFL